MTESKISDPDINLTNDLDITKIIKDLENFFEIKAPNYEIFLAHSREEFNKLTNRQSSETWMAGWANESKIVAISPDKLEELTLGLHKKDSHPNRIKHELAHLFYNKLANGGTKPAWLNEGLAYYLDGHGGMPPKAKEDRYAAIKYFNNFDGHVYTPGSFMVKTLLDKFGKEKLLKLIKSIQPNLTEEIFQNLFQKIYGFSFTEEDFIRIEQSQD